MNETLKSIKNYIQSLPPSQSNDLSYLHSLIIKHNPHIKLWYLDGTNNTGKIITNPNVGYGEQLIIKNKVMQPFYKVGLSATSIGISLYIIGLKEKNYLKDQFGITLGKAKISSYCIKFKALNEINIVTLLKAIQFGLRQ